MSEKKLNKVQRLAIAGAVAPTLRADADRLSRRVVKLYDQRADPEAKAARPTTGLDAVKGILSKALIEFDVEPDSEASGDDLTCARCGQDIVHPKRAGRRLRYCHACRAVDRCAGCAENPDCERRPSSQTVRRWRQRNLEAGELWRCQGCAISIRKSAAGRSCTGQRCAGFRNITCDAVASRTSRVPSNGEPWRCRPCATRRAHLKDGAQVYCAGRGPDGKPCGVMVPQPARNPERVRKRRGRLWVCPECRPRKGAAKRLPLPGKPCLHCGRPFGPKNAQQYTCPGGCPCVVNGCLGRVSVDRAKDHAKREERARCASCWGEYVKTDEYRDVCAARKRAEWERRSDEERDAIFSKTRSHWTPDRRAEARAKSLARLEGA